MIASHIATAAMVDDSMEISSEHNYTVDDDIDIDIDITAGQDEEDYAIENAAAAHGGDDLMFDDDDTSFQMNDIDTLEGGDTQILDPQPAGMSFDTGAHDVPFADDYLQVPEDEAKPDTAFEDEYLQVPEDQPDADDTAFGDEYIQVPEEEVKPEIRDAAFGNADLQVLEKEQANAENHNACYGDDRLHVSEEQVIAEIQDASIPDDHSHIPEEQLGADGGITQETVPEAEAKDTQHSAAVDEDKLAQELVLEADIFDDGLDVPEAVAVPTIAEEHFIRTEEEVFGPHDDGLNDPNTEEENWDLDDGLDFEAPATKLASASSTVSEQHAVRVQQVKVSYRDTDYNLFSASQSDDPDTFFLSDFAVAEQPLQSFFKAIRDVIHEDLGPEELLFITIEEFGLEFEEASITSQSINLGNIMNLRDKLLQNDGSDSLEYLPPMHLLLGTKPNFSAKYANLAAAAADGKGLSELAVSWDESEHVEDFHDCSTSEGGAIEKPEDTIQGNLGEDLIDYSDDELEVRAPHKSLETNGDNRDNEDYETKNKKPRQRSLSYAVEGKWEGSHQQQDNPENGNEHGGNAGFGEKTHEDDFGLDLNDDGDGPCEAAPADEVQLESHGTMASANDTRDGGFEDFQLDENAGAEYDHEALDEIDFGDEDDAVAQQEPEAIEKETGPDQKTFASTASGSHSPLKEVYAAGSELGPGEAPCSESAGSEHTLQATDELEIQNGDEIDEIDYDDDKEDVGDALDSQKAQTVVPVVLASTPGKRSRSDTNQAGDVEVQSSEAKRQKS